MTEPVPTGPTEPAETPAPPPRPTSITAATVLFAAVSLLSLVQLFFVGTYRPWMERLITRQFDVMNVPDYARSGIDSSISMSLVQTGIGLAISVGFWALIAVFVHKGKNWARILSMVFGMIGAIVGPLSVIYTLALAPPPAAYLLTAVPANAAIIAGMVLVWREPAKRWIAWQQYLSAPRW